MNIGDKMPDMLGKDAEGKDIRLSDFPGKKFIIYFYPKDNTPGCTAEAVSLRDNYETLLKMGYQVIGVSKDSEASHQKFAAKHELPFLSWPTQTRRYARRQGFGRKRKWPAGNIWALSARHSSATTTEPSRMLWQKSTPREQPNSFSRCSTEEGQ